MCSLSNDSYIMVVKLLKQDLNVWNKEVFRNISIRKIVALNQIGFWDSKEREATLSVEEFEARKTLVDEFNK